MANFRLGCAPIVWNNEDQQAQFGPPVAFETLLEEVKEAGYAATELGLGFPREPRALEQALDARGLVLTSAWCGLRLVDATPDADLEHTRRLCDLLAGVGARFVNLAHQGSTAHEVEWDRLAERVVQAAEIARGFGLQAAFHQHAGTFVETGEQLDALLRRTPADLVKLCWDVGHAIYGGIDPVRVVREHAERIVYIHLKDVDDSVLSGVRNDRVGFDEAIRRRVFTEVGSGCLDVPGLLSALRDIDYDGWLMVEQDTTWLTPIESARRSRAFLRSLGL
jgi:inosose dehydratase